MSRIQHFVTILLTLQNVQGDQDASLFFFLLTAPPVSPTPPHPIPQSSTALSAEAASPLQHLPGITTQPHIFASKWKTKRPGHFMHFQMWVWTLLLLCYSLHIFNNFLLPTQSTLQLAACLCREHTELQFMHPSFVTCFIPGFKFIPDFCWLQLSDTKTLLKVEMTQQPSVLNLFILPSILVELNWMAYTKLRFQAATQQLSSTNTVKGWAYSELKTAPPIPVSLQKDTGIAAPLLSH